MEVYIPRFGTHLTQVCRFEGRLVQGDVRIVFALKPVPGDLTLSHRRVDAKVGVQSYSARSVLKQTRLKMICPGFALGVAKIREILRRMRCAATPG